MMVELSRKLASNAYHLQDESGNFLNEGRLMGFYNRRRFVLGLSDEVHDMLGASTSGSGEVYLTVATPEVARAFSTYLHETIHWWQHIGSFAGFLQTNLFPANAHLNHDRLHKVLTRFGPKKSLKDLLEREMRASPESDLNDLNIIINNDFDIKAFIALTQDVSNFEPVWRSRFFEGRGHCFTIAYQALISILSVYDAQFTCIPSPEVWEEECLIRKRSEKPEYCYGSVIRQPPIGLHQIFEGQARFSQLQYLYFASGRRLTWEDCATQGYFGDVYIEPFELFLHLAEQEFPDNLSSPTVALFLLVCDLAINPTDGFPQPIRSFDTFIDDADPGTRFFRLCRAVASDKSIGRSLVGLTRDEYVHASRALCALAQLSDPFVALEEVIHWKNRNVAIAEIVGEGAAMCFSPENMPVRLSLAKFIAFCEDKFLTPEYFCWSGSKMAEPFLHPRARVLFQRHQSLFTNRSDKRGVYPRLLTAIDPANCLDTLNKFYAWNGLYDMVGQLIAEPGRFDLAYDWLSDEDNETIFQWANRIFSDQFGIRPEEFEIL